MTVVIMKFTEGFFIAILCFLSIVTGEVPVDNLQVESPEDGVPSLDTGLYLLSQESPFDGHIKALNACAFLTEPNLNTQGIDTISLYFFVATYRLIGNIFKRVTGTLLFFINIERTRTFGCNVRSLTNEEQLLTKVLKGDRTGVFVQQVDCGPFPVLGQPAYFCPAHVNIIDPLENCSQSLYFNNTRLEGDNMDQVPAELDAVDGNPVNVFINLNTVVEPNSPQNAQASLEQVCATQFNVTRTSSRPNNNLAIALSLIAGGVIFIGTVIIGVVFFVYCRRWKENKKPQEEISYHDRLRLESDPNVRLQNNAHYHKPDVEESDTAVIATIHDHEVVLQSNACYNQFNRRAVEEHRSSHLAESYHSYVINSLGKVGNVESDEELYWQPASKEEDLKHQLKKLKVDEVVKENIVLKEYLGSGQFGIVYRGLLTVSGVDSEGGVKEVAVKTMENGASEEQRIKFLQEAAIMGQFNNLYVIKIYGILTSNQPYMIICELMNKGDLHRHLHTIKILGTLNQDEAGAMLLSYSRQVASAMVYLSMKGYIHRDLAGRNILLSMDGVCKISDFGLSRNLRDEDYYVAHSGLIPLRWTAPEALQDGKFSTASDVWSYGIVLYEIWSLASKPYGSLSNEQVVSKLVIGHRLPSPPGCPRAIYQKMMSCWHPDSIHRPMFNDLQISLQQPDYELLKWSDEDKGTYSENARTIGATFQDKEVLFEDMQRMYEI